MTDKLVAVPLIAIVILAVYALLVPVTQQIMANIPAPADLPSLPRTKHAEIAHMDQAWNAASVASYMATSCKPEVYQCGDALHYYCADPLLNGNLIALLIGAQSNQVITGFTARMSYWMDRLSCSKVEVPW